jgi:hypothetical protein
VFWVAIAGDRERFASDLRAQLRGESAAIIVVRDVRFDDPNSVMVDLGRLLHLNRDSCIEQLPKTNIADARCALVLVSRTEFPIGQCSSPITAPEWFPGFGGQQVFCSIEDVTSRIDVFLNAPELDLFELHHRLFALEQAILRRLVHATSVDPQAHEDLARMLRRGAGEEWPRYLDEVARSHAGIDNFGSFRPKISEGRYLVARLWGEAKDATSAKSFQLCDALVRALNIGEAVGRDWHLGFLSLLSQSGAAPKRIEITFARNLLAVIAQACQFLNCAAHADDYGRYPLNLLRSTLWELRDTLASCETTLAIQT